MAHTFGEEKEVVSKISIDGDFMVYVYKKHYYEAADGTEILISDTMNQPLEPGDDLSGDEWYMTDTVRAICAQQWDEESVAEWEAMSDEEKDVHRQTSDG